MIILTLFTSTSGTVRHYGLQITPKSSNDSMKYYRYYYYEEGGTALRPDFILLLLFHYYYLLYNGLHIFYLEKFYSQRKRIIPLNYKERSN
jgi:hypothetical protein